MFDCIRFHHNQYANAQTPFFNKYSESNSVDILSQVPIYLVNTSQYNKKYEVEFFGHAEQVTVPQYIEPSGIDMEKAISEMTHESMLSITVTSGHVRESIVDKWGLYSREHPVGKAYRVNESKPKIFIWIDKILEYVKNDKNLFRILSAQVILHELAHAALDERLLGDETGKDKLSIPRSFIKAKEESLAQAISLYLLRPHLNETEMQYLLDVSNSLPLEYAVANEYLNFKGNIYNLAATWKNIKQNNWIAIPAAIEWIKYIQRPKPLDTTELFVLDEAMFGLNGAFRYPAGNGKLYNNNNVCVKVITDYAACHTFSRAQIHSAFPDDVNGQYEAIIDYPEQKEFHDKEMYDETFPAEDGIILSCTDGKVSVCDVWDPLGMDRFIENAKRFGILIETISMGGNY